MYKVLIVDDDSATREAVSAMLSGTYEVREAAGKEQMYEVLKDFAADAIILDVMMDTQDAGFQLSRELKGSETYKNVKILMLTSVDSVTGIDFKSSAGDPDWNPVDDYMEKPADPTVLLEKLGNLLSGDTAAP